MKELTEVKGIRAKIFVENNFNESSGCHMLAQFTDANQVVISLTLELSDGKKENVILCTVYFPGTANEEEMITEKFEELVNYCNKNKLELLIACDANAHCTDWYCDHTDARGESFALFCMGKGLQLINDGLGKPTFKPRGGERPSKGTIIDLHWPLRGLLAASESGK